jgi:hypothetical protein
MIHISLSFHSNFMVKRSFNSRVMSLGMVTLDVIARDFELTPTISQKVEDKIGKALKKFRLEYISSHVVLRLHKNPSNGKKNLANSN